MTNRPITEEQWARLPAYARRYIEKLESDLRHVQEDREAMDGGLTDTWIDGRGLDGNRHLPDGTPVVFAPERGEPVRVMVRNGEVTVDTDQQLMVLTRSGNVAVVLGGGFR